MSTQGVINGNVEYMRGFMTRHSHENRHQLEVFEFIRKSFDAEPETVQVQKRDVYNNAVRCIRSFVLVSTVHQFKHAICANV